MTAVITPLRYAELDDGTFHVFHADAEITFNHRGVKTPVDYEWPEVGIVDWMRMLEVCRLRVHPQTEVQLELIDQEYRERKRWARPTRPPVRRPRVLGM